MIAPALQGPLDWIAQQQARMVALTESWSRINSGSYNIAGIRRFKNELETAFAMLGGVAETIPLDPLMVVNSAGEEVAVPMADAWTMRKRPEAPIQILLVGHMDTVYGLEHPFQEPVYPSPEILNGPGVADLKGGLVVMLHALAALEQFPGKERVGWQVLLNPDEEIGSQSSDPLLKQSSTDKHLGLVYEPAMADGALAGARKGSGNFSIIVKGKAAHAGRNPEDGRNAIVACAEITSHLFALNGIKPGLTVNPGKVEGGGALNTVPDLAILRFNIRLQQAEDEAFILQEIQKILDPFQGRNGFSVSLHGRFTRRPKPMSAANEAVFSLVESCAKDLGMGWRVVPSGGCCDGNNLWHHGLPNVDTLGVRGAFIHSDKEIVYLESLTERAQLSALLLMRLADGTLLPPTH
jgi:glutamate carboxypeptidase